MNKAIVDYFIHTYCNHIIFDRVLHIINNVLSTFCNIKARQMRFNIIQTMDAANFFADISVAGNIRAPGRRGYYKFCTFLLYTELQFFQSCYHFFFRNGNAYSRIDCFRAHLNNSRHIRNRISINNAGNSLTGFHAFQKISSAVQGIPGQHSINATFETTGGFTAQTKCTACPSDADTVKGGCFQHNVYCRPGYFGFQTTHYATKANCMLCITNNNHTVSQCSFLFVKSNEFLFVLSPSYY